MAGRGFDGLLSAIAGDLADAEEIRRLAALSPSKQATPEFLAALEGDGSPAALRLAGVLPCLDGDPEGFAGLDKETQRAVLAWGLGLPDRTPCAAVVLHGPGHQSKTKCDRLGPHEVHHADPMGDDLYWRGDAGCTGAFDESPLDEEEYWTDFYGEA